MAPSWYQLRPPYAQGDQFKANQPPGNWPAGVDTCAAGSPPNAPHLHTIALDIPTSIPINDGDWAVTFYPDGGRTVLSDAAFKARYSPSSPPSD